MTDRAEIERLLNMTGRTLEGLPTQDDYCGKMTYGERAKVIQEIVGRSGFVRDVALIMHQSDVIELLIAALRDALDKPKQKPPKEGE